MTFGKTSRTVVAARLVNGAFIAMYCAGLLTRTPWLAQTICWAVLLPGAVWLALESRAHGPAAGPRPLYWVIVGGLAAYLAVLLAATIVADPQWKVLPKQIFGAALCVMTVAAVGEASRHDRHFSAALGRIYTLASAIAAVTLLAWFIQLELIDKIRLFGLYPINWVLNPNALAAVYAISFAVAIGHGLRRDISKWERVIVFAIGMLMLAMVFLTKSRGGILACLAVMGVALLASHVRIVVGLVVLTAAACASIALIFPNWTVELFARGDNLRLQLWLHFLQLSESRPLLGFGLNFDPRFMIGENTIYTPHNIFLAALIRGGAIALAVLVVVMAAAAWAVVKAARAGWWLPGTVLVSTLVLTSVDHEMVPGTFSYYWYIFWLPLALAVAAASLTSLPSNDAVSGHTTTQETAVSVSSQRSPAR